MLYIVATPIGNLQDMTLRALEVLKDVDLIAAEDTRHTKKLLSHFDIHTSMVSYHDHNARAKAPVLVEKLRQGHKMALVTDAGTPCIADPGYRLVKAAREAGIQVVTVPGACAAVAALSISGLPSDQFTFKGFLPPKSGARRKRLLESKEASGTVIFYESPHRLIKALTDAVEVLDDPQICVARELTKAFEEVITAPASTCLAHFTAHPPKGEFVILLHLDK